MLLILVEVEWFCCDYIFDIISSIGYERIEDKKWI